MEGRHGGKNLESRTRNGRGEDHSSMVCPSEAESTGLPREVFTLDVNGSMFRCLAGVKAVE